ncbi:hypothetical protein HMPREF0080_00979 [Anaeroglobus geminatus F0357]|uniref:Uncharacterized protein n=1 Tax=Anaeroglobus geminatus F0357 TaxID=861450 RepID=G9YH52_9FIRM|nr:hypothetical protein HMPREF0080_00979 [Anaeroglobus geminatus F0357]
MWLPGKSFPASITVAIDAFFYLTTGYGRKRENKKTLVICSFHEVKRYKEVFKKERIYIISSRHMRSAPFSRN